MSDDHESAGGRTPVLLLKTRSSPTDAYEELFSKSRVDGFEFAPVFVPVLEHRLLDAGMDRVRTLLRTRSIGRGPECAYGGLVFTSQRAVEAFSQLVAEESGDGTEAGAEAAAGSGPARKWPCLQDVPVYSVGPATSRALRAIKQEPAGLWVTGEHTGNGDALSKFILEHYGALYGDRPVKPPLLFLVGEQRRDIIPRTLMGADLSESQRIQVDEVVVYGTGVVESFERDLREALKVVSAAAGNSTGSRWVVVFSPVGCDSLLRCLDLLDLPGTDRRPSHGSNSPLNDSRGPGQRSTLVATIGPTTRAHLQDSFGFEPDVCSAQPTPEGLCSGITEHMANMRLDRPC